jgi:hypothetical protein
VRRPESEWQGTVERPDLAIVDADLWERANQMRAVNRQTSPRNAREPSLLHGLVYCEHDHGDGLPRKMTFKVGKKHRPTWRCPWKAASGGPYCRGQMVAPTLEELVWERLVELAQEPERVLASMAASVQQMRERRQGAAGRLAACEAEAAKQVQTLDALTVRWLAGEVPDEQYRRLRPRLEEMSAAAARARDEMAAQLRDLEQSCGWVAGGTALEGLARIVRNAFAHGVPCAGQALGLDERRRDIKRLVERITVGPEGASIVVALTGKREPLVNTASPGCG